MDKEIQETNNHIIFSKIEPTVQKAEDIWVVIGEFADKNTTSTEGENNGEYISWQISESYQGSFGYK